MLEVEIQTDCPRHLLGVRRALYRDHTPLRWCRRAHAAVEAIFAAREGRVCRVCHLHLPSTFFSLAEGESYPCLCCHAERQKRHRAAAVPPLELPAHKRCSRCKMVKDASDFCRKKASSDGLQSWCKDCMTISSKKFRAATAAVPTPAAALPPTSWCSGCSSTKPRAAFRRNITSADGLNFTCRDCFSKSYARRKEASKAPPSLTVASPPPIVR